MHVRDGRVVDEQRRLAQLGRRLDQLLAIFARREAAAELVGVDPPLRAEHALGQFEAGHFQAHKQRGHVGLDGHVFGHVGGQRGLAHARPGGQHHELRVVQPAGQIVEVLEAGGHAHPFAVLQAGVDAVESLDQQVVDFDDLVGAPLVVDGEDLLLRPAHHFPGLDGGLVGVAEDFGAGVDQGPQGGLVADDFRIIDGVGRIGNRMDHFGQVGRAAHGLQVAAVREPLEEQGGVDAQAQVVHGQQMGVEFLVGVGVEVGGPHHQRHVVAQVGVQQQAAEHAFFGVEILRRQAVEDFGTDGGGGAARVSAVSSSHGKSPPIAMRGR